MEDLQAIRSYSDEQLFGAMFNANDNPNTVRIYQSEAARRQMLASKKAAEAAERSAVEAARYAKLTLWVVIFTGLTAVATLLGALLR